MKFSCVLWPWFNERSPVTKVVCVCHVICVSHSANLRLIWKAGKELCFYNTIRKYIHAIVWNKYDTQNPNEKEFRIGLKPSCSSYWPLFLNTHESPIPERGARLVSAGSGVPPPGNAVAEHEPLRRAKLPDPMVRCKRGVEDNGGCVQG